MSLVLFNKPVAAEWIDYNGHLNDGYYAQIFSWATDEMLIRIGLDAATRTSTKRTIYTLETHVRFLSEMKLGEEILVRCEVLERDVKRLRLILTMHNRSRGDVVAATSEQLLISVDQSGDSPKTAAWLPSVEAAIAAMPVATTPWPDHIGRGIALKRS